MRATQRHSSEDDNAVLSISCVSMISPVGYTPQSMAAALRAGISAFQELVYRDRTGSNIIGAMVTDVPVETRGQARLRTLATAVFKTIPPGFVEALPWNQMPMLMCMPENPRPGPRLRKSMTRERLPDGNMSAPTRTILIEGGPVAVFEAIDQARRLLAHREIPGCLILAIDSLIDARVLAWLDQDYRLKTLLQTDGVIPGEASCLAIVTRTPIVPTALTLLGLGLAHETATVLNDDPLLGRGMAQAVGRALSEAGLEMHDVDFRISDVAGESYAFEELVLAQTRLTRRTRPSQPLWHHADCIGDCGAAAGLIQFAWAEQAFARGYAPGAIAALHGSSAFGARAAAIVTPSGASGLDEP
jgi:3-oxoacyl-[acyl-carrier-protein] synthase-1